jgi:dTDP-4-dehydrorhamnose reductase
MNVRKSLQFENLFQIFNVFLHSFLSNSKIQDSESFLKSRLSDASDAEFNNTNPVNYYGTCKLMAEQALKQSNCRHSIVRTAIIYDYPQHIKRSNIFRWIHNSLSDNQQIKQANDQYRTPTFVDDLAIVLLKISILEKEGIWHYAGNEKMSVYEFGVKIAEPINLDKKLIQPVSSADLNQIARRPAKTYLNSNYANRELGLPPHNISQGFDVIKARID